MAPWQHTLLQATLQPVEADVSVAVTLRSLAGSELGSLHLRVEESLQDLEDALRKLASWDPGDLVQLRSVQFPEVDLDRSALVKSLASESELAITRYELGLWLDRFPDTGKFLRAMQDSAFDPHSPNFNVNWTLETAEEVGPHETSKLVKDALPPLEAQSASRFVRVYGRLRAKTETADLMNLQKLKRGPVMMCFKHVLHENWIEHACFAATRRVAERPKAICLLKSDERGWIGGVNVMGHSFPANMSRELAGQLALNDAASFRLMDVFRVLMFLDVDWDTEDAACETFRMGVLTLTSAPEMSPNDLLRLVHIQVRLSSMGVAEVEGELDQRHVRFLAGLLRYRFSRPEDRKGHLLENLEMTWHGDDRGVLLLVSNVAREEVWHLVEAKAKSSQPVRVILCDCVR